MPGLVRGMARTAVVAGTATAVSGRVARRQAEIPAVLVLLRVAHPLGGFLDLHLSSEVPILVVSGVPT